MKKSDAQINKIPLFDSKGKKSDTVELNKDVFNGKFKEALLYQTLVMYRQNQRKGLASTKTRAEVRGGGKKPWRQKGTGRARVASTRNPIWRGGGVAFGPHTRDFRYNIPKKMKKAAFLASLNAKLKKGNVIALEDMAIPEPKTRVVSNILKKLNAAGRILIIAEKIDRNLALASRNIKGLTLKELRDTMAFDVLSCDRVIITRKAAEALNKKVTA